MTRHARFLVSLGVVFSLCLGAAQASADTPLAWSPPQLVDHQQPFSGNRYVSDIDCPSASLCMAVDEDGNILSSTDPTGGIEDWDIASVFPGQTLGDISCASVSLCVAVGEEGRIFSSTEPDEGAAAWDAVETDPERFLEGVSCPSASLCVAVDDDGNALSSTNPTGNAGSWHRVSVIPGTIMRDVSCRSVSLCVAVGDGGVAIASTDPTGSASAWHQGDSDLESGLTSVSCPTTSLCVAAGEQGEAIASTDPASAAVPWSTVSIEPGRYMTAISCPSETLCAIAAAGGRILASTDPTDDASWSSVEADSENFLGSMSCPSASLCVAGDGSGNVITSTNPGDEPPTWTVVNVDGFNSIRDISCPAESLCVAVDGSGNALVAQAPGDESGAWALANIDPGNSLSGISCLPTPLCVAVDGAGNVLTSSNPVGGAATWSPPVNIAGGDELTAVSCASAILCAAVDAAGHVHTSSNPTGGAGAWNSAQIAAGEYLGSVFCRPTSFCAAVDGAGNAFTSANPTGGADHWHSIAASPDAPLLDIACPSISLCVSVGVQGTIATSTNPTSVSPAWDLTEVETEGLQTVACPSPALCVATSGEGDVVMSTDPLAEFSWEVTHIGDSRAYAEDRRPISCPSLMLCMMATTDGRVLRGTPTSGSLAGTVTDSSTSAGIPGIVVCAQNSFEEQCETTDGAGEYTIAGLAEGFWRVQFAPPYSESNYVTQYYSGVSSIFDAAIVGITPGAAITAVDAQLQEGGRIAGKVTDAVSKGPVFNSLVCAFHASDEEFDRCTSTDSDGEYTLTGLATGSYKLRFSSPTTGTNYIEQHYNGKRWLQNADEVEVTAGDTTSGIDVELEEAARIEGTVIDASNDEEIANVEVCIFKEAMDGDFIFQECTYTGGGGEYTLSGLRTGNYKIEFHADGGLNYITQFYEGKASLEDADPIAVTAGVDITGIDAEMRRGAQIKGKAIDAVSKAPIPGLQICVYRASDGEQESCTGSDEEGEYTLSGLETGAYKVGFFSIDYEEGTNGLNYIAQYHHGKSSLATAEPISVTAGLQTTGIDAEMHEGGRIEGEVIDAVGKQIVRGVTVCAFKVGETEAERCSFSNSGGEYAITALPTGAYKVKFFESYDQIYLDRYYDGESSLEDADSVSVTAGFNVTGIDAEMHEGGRIGGTVTAAQTHDPLREILVCALDDAEEWIRCTWTDEDGEYTLTGFDDGLYRVVFSPEESLEEDAYETRYYDEEASLDDADFVSVSAPLTTAGIDAELSELSVGEPPESIDAPLLSGTPAVGATLSCDPGNWANAPTDYAYRWLRDGSPISGQTAGTYQVQDPDRGHGISCEVTASNASGDASAASNALQIPAATSDPPGGDPTGGDPGPSPPLPTGTNPNGPVSTPAKKPLKCRKGFKKRKVKGKVRCVRPKKKPPSAAAGALR